MAAKALARRGSKIAENTASLVVSGAAGLIFTVIQLGLLSRSLPGDYFGLFVALRGFSLLLSTVLLAGLPQVLIRYLPSYQSRGKQWRALLLFVISTFAVLALGFILYIGMDSWRGWIPEGLNSLVHGTVTLWMLLASVTLALKLLLYGGFNGLREMRMQMFLEPLYLCALTIYIFVNRAELSVLRLFQIIFLLNGIVFCIGLPIFIVFVRRLIGEGESDGHEQVVLPSFFPYWGGAIVLSFVALAFTDVDRFVMSSVLPVSAVSIFHVASRINGLLKRFLGMPVVAAQPEITRVYEQGRGEELAGKLGLFTKGIFVASILSTGLVAVIGKDVITVLSGSAYSGAYRILLVLLPTVPVAAIVAPLLIMMRSLHFMHWAVLCDFVWMAGYFGTFSLFVSWWGVLGMGVAQIAATAIQMFVAVALARREGFYGGFGTRLARVLLVVPAVPLGMVVTARFGVAASIACVAVFPLACKLIVRALGVFDETEKRQITEIVPGSPGRRLAAWLLSVET
ncbi:MAG TPA: lipopolysaccharide biosynthesis protein [Patescibacteria group bacterium]|nr:lipopolysaccharide biosynthesis protein [Patescibacteria group bacterium]